MVFLHAVEGRPKVYPHNASTVQIAMHGRRPRRLARDYAVIMLSPVSSIRTLRGLPSEDTARKACVGFGDPLFSREQIAEATVETPVTVAEHSARGLRTRGL